MNDQGCPCAAAILPWLYYRRSSGGTSLKGVRDKFVLNEPHGACMVCGPHAPQQRGTSSPEPVENWQRNKRCVSSIITRSIDCTSMLLYDMLASVEIDIHGHPRTHSNVPQVTALVGR